MRPNKSLGQHFLIDQKVAARIVGAAEIDSEDVILEIGPGKGALTRLLVQQARSVIAIELDGGLAQRLSTSMVDHDRLTVVEDDARTMRIESLLDQRQPYKLVSNLPYYAAQPIIRRFLETIHKPVLMVVMVQHEVAQEMVAEPGDMRLLSVATQLYGRPKIVAVVPPRAFKPMPQVNSAVVRIDIFDELPIEMESENKFFKIVKAGFSTPRKQIHNSLAIGLGSTKEVARLILGQAGIDPTRRPQTLTLEEWGALYRSWCADEY